MGEGIALEIGNSFYFYDKNGEVSYFGHDRHAERVIVDLIRAGYIDCLHSYGDRPLGETKSCEHSTSPIKLIANSTYGQIITAPQVTLAASSNAPPANVGVMIQVRKCIMLM